MKAAVEDQLLQFVRDDCWYSCGLREKNSCNLLCDCTSADAFCTPGNCWAVMHKSRTAARKASIRSKCDKVGSLADPLFTAATTAALSQRHWMHLLSQYGPHRVTATTIGPSSFGAIVIEAHDSGHCSWNQRFSCAAPQPQEPDASDTKMSGGVVGGMMLTPFHVCKKVCHHARSARAARLMWTQWSGSFTVAPASMRLRRKAHPGLTTVAA